MPARARCAWSKSELARQTCRERLGFTWMELGSGCVGSLQPGMNAMTVDPQLPTVLKLAIQVQQRLECSLQQPHKPRLDVGI